MNLTLGCFNFLPWREHLRQKNQRDFFRGLMGAGCLMVMLWGISAMILIKLSEKQRDTNMGLQQKIASLNVQMKILADFREQQLIARQQIANVEAFRRENRLKIKIWDDIAKTVPEGMVITELKYHKNTVALAGVAETHFQLTRFVHELNTLSWVNNLQINQVIAKAQEKNSGIKFELQIVV